ncbi:hypothetical protein [Streptomyces sp. NPDC016845]|uniref:hypothetical protein n=1 Tax=Streptomyces sp. NPDC016845 TaxID=3364972 RepID=UPI00379569A9
MVRDERRYGDERGRGGVPDGLLVGLLAFLLGMTIMVWTATGLAGLFTKGAWPSNVTFGRTPLAMRSLIAEPHNIPGAWPATPKAELSNYGLFWGLFIGQLMILVVLAIFVAGTVARWRAVRRSAKYAKGTTRIQAERIPPSDDQMRRAQGSGEQTRGAAGPGAAPVGQVPGAGGPTPDAGAAERVPGSDVPDAGPAGWAPSTAYLDQVPGPGTPQPTGQTPNTPYSGQAPGPAGQAQNGAYSGQAPGAAAQGPAGQAPGPAGQAPNGAYSGQAPGPAGQAPNGAYSGQALGAAAQGPAGQAPNTAYPGQVPDSATPSTAYPGQAPGAAAAGPAGQAPNTAYPGQAPGAAAAGPAPTAPFGQAPSLTPPRADSHHGAQPPAHNPADPTRTGQPEPAPGAAPIHPAPWPQGPAQVVPAPRSAPGPLLLGPPADRHPHAIQAIRDAEGPALVITSAAKVWQETKDARAKLGPVLLYDPTHRCDTPARMHWNPAAGCKDRSTATTRAAALLAPIRPTARLDSALAETAETLLRSYLHAAAVDGKPFRHVHRWAQGNQIQDAVRILRTNPKAAGGSAGELEAALTSHPERRDMAQELTARALSALFTIHVRESCTPNRTDALTLDSFVDEGGTLYVVGEPIEDPKANPGAMPLLTALASSVVEHGRRMADRSPAGRLDPPMTLVLDDVAAVAPLPQLPELLAAGAGRGLPTLALLRSREQGRSRWPDAELPTP